ncbi:MAG: lipase family protein [Mycobacterium sp.]|nr:lipase family protein [Mycobacterium sp.]
MRKALPWIVVSVIVVAGLTAATYLRPLALIGASKFMDMFIPLSGAPAPIGSADLAGSGPGTLLSATTMPGVTSTFDGQGVRAARVVYRSTEGDTGAQSIVSGSVLVPDGKAPKDGWPVVALGHGTLGIDNNCAPSLSPTLMNLLPIAQVVIKLGYAVALPDYQGLGVKGIHPYSDARTAGLNMIDAVRAARHVFGDVSTTWAAFGDSQGGAAAWAANEQAGPYAPELKLVGAVAISPAADITGLVAKSQAGNLTTEQRPVLQALIESLARLHPDLNRDDYRHGGAARYWNVLSDCSSAGAYKRGVAAEQLGPRDFVPVNQAAYDQLQNLLQAWAIPQRRLTAPLYVWYGGQDPYIDAGWTRAAIGRACALGGPVTITFDPKGEHNPTEAQAMLDWMADRFAGKQVTNDC